ncbi:MAG: rhomboid family intramembrane serine protease [Isosphaeraceae bacterium]
MRQIGTIAEEGQARRIGDYLRTLGITTRLDDSPGGWIVWVHDENRLEEARRELEAFRRAPDDPRYEAAEATARALRKKAEKADREHARRTIDLRDRWLYRSPRRLPATLFLIAMSVGIFVLRLVEPDRGRAVSSAMRITALRVIRPEEPEPAIWLSSLWSEHLGDLIEVRNGEVWRLLTPIFLHFSFLHLAFNMFWMAELGGQFEMLRRSWRLALFVVACGVFSNLVEYLWSGPGFGGMSGVVYALFGHAWVRSHYDPSGPWRLRGNAVPIMLIWLPLGMTGILGPIANGAHLGGLAIGMAIGAIPFARQALRPW